MADIIHGFTVSCSNTSARQIGSVCVKRDGAVFAKVKSKRSGLLNYMRKYILCVERQEFCDQMRRSGVPEGTIAEILKMPVKG